MNETSAPKLRVATYNVHGCVGMDRQRSEARIAEVIAQLSVDIVALQELDLSRS
jgi:endonuclease/exonuclease/phosphatase family metal-dependent hydrolase